MANKVKCFYMVPTGEELKVEFEINGKVYERYEPVYRSLATGEKMTMGEFPVGAIWRNTWYEGENGMSSMCGPDGRSFSVRTPGGDWCIDGRASNCTRVNDDKHKCWCRHGEPPNFTVNKVGNTCSAGAGSILKGTYHGFLINGELTNC